jgi:hypothetical protein
VFKEIGDYRQPFPNIPAALPHHLAAWNGGDANQELDQPGCRNIITVAQNHVLERSFGMKKIYAALTIVLVMLIATSAAYASPAAASRNFVAPLSGAEEVLPVDTSARGLATLKLSKDGTELGYSLMVANIQNVTQAHIHCGAAGVNGPVVAFLFGLEPAGVSVNGILAEGVITDANIIPRPDSEVCPGGVATFDELLSKIRSGDAYVNVHTTAYPGGEIRGQIR